MFKKLLSVFLVLLIAITPSLGYAQQLPMANTLLTEKFLNIAIASDPVLIKGMVLYPQEPLKFRFLVDTGHQEIEESYLKQESERMVKYFLTAVTIPEQDQWVNLSPIEKDRVIADSLAQTALGRDMLAQDYVLKQFSASLLDPTTSLGQEFWKKVYQQVYEKLGITEVPLDSFHKVWIMPDVAEVFEHKNAVYITKARLKVMLDSDYQMIQEKQKKIVDEESGVSQISQQVMRDIVLPIIEEEVNTGAHFFMMRQMYYAGILARWYRDTIKESLMERAYVNQSKIKGVDLKDLSFKEKIYQRYMQAYQKGVVHVIHEQKDIQTGEMIPKKYFSGGMPKVMPDEGAIVRNLNSSAVIDSQRGDMKVVDFMIKKATREDASMVAFFLQQINQPFMFNPFFDAETVSVTYSVEWENTIYLEEGGFDLTIIKQEGSWLFRSESLNFSKEIPFESQEKVQIEVFTQKNIKRDVLTVSLPTRLMPFFRINLSAGFQHYFFMPTKNVQKDDLKGLEDGSQALFSKKIHSYQDFLEVMDILKTAQQDPQKQRRWWIGVVAELERFKFSVGKLKDEKHLIMKHIDDAIKEALEIAEHKHEIVIDESDPSEFNIPSDIKTYQEFRVLFEQFRLAVREQQEIPLKIWKDAYFEIKMFQKRFQGSVVEANVVDNFLFFLGQQILQREELQEPQSSIEKMVEDSSMLDSFAVVGLTRELRRLSQGVEKDDRLRLEALKKVFNVIPLAWGEVNEDQPSVLFDGTFVWGKEISYLKEMKVLCCQIQLDALKEGVNVFLATQQEVQLYRESLEAKLVKQEPVVGGIDIQEINFYRVGEEERFYFNEQALKDLVQTDFDGFTPVFLGVISLKNPLNAMGIK